MRTVEHVFRPRPPLWVWPALLGYLTLAGSVGHFLGWRLAAVAVAGTAVIVFALRPEPGPARA